MDAPLAIGLTDRAQDVGRTPSRAALRSVLYALLAAAAAAPLLFRQLNSMPLAEDEARYANCVEVIRETGQWLTITDVPGRPYFQKPPLYMWLGALTYDLLGEGEVKYRFWSAAFALATVALTCLLGGLLLSSPEAGLLAAAILMLDEQWLFTHGARTGTMDTALQFLLLGCAVAYWFAWHGRGSWRRTAAWFIIGLLAAAASLFKPLMGVLFIALFAVHGLALGRPAPWWQRAAGPLLALVVCAAVAGPWYLDQYQQFGQPFAEKMLLRNLWGRVVRARDPATERPWYYYLGTAGRSFGGPALGPALLVLALGASAAAAFRHPVARLRRAHGLLAFLAASWLVIISLTKTKYSHYAYAVYPIIALSVAALLLGVAGWLLRRVRDDATRRRLAAGAVVAAVGWFGFRHAVVLYDVIPSRRVAYSPWEVYQSLRDPIDQGRVSLVFCGFGPTPLDWERDVPGLDSRDHYYLRRIRGQSIAADVAPEEVPRLLVQRRPAVLIVTRRLEELVTRDAATLGRPDQRFAHEQDSLLVAAVNVDGVTDLRWTPAAAEQSPMRVLLRDGSPLPSDGRADLAGGLRLRSAHGWSQDAWISVRVESGAPPPAGRWALRVGRDKLADAIVYAAPGGYRVSGFVRSGQWRKALPRDKRLELILEPTSAAAGVAGVAGGSAAPGRVVEARIMYYPEPLGAR